MSIELKPAVAFDVAAEGAPKLSPLMQYIIARFEALKSEGENSEGQIFDFVHAVQEIGRGCCLHDITGFFKHPAVGESQDRRGYFPALGFHLGSSGKEAMPVLFCGNFVNRAQGRVEMPQPMSSRSMYLDPFSLEKRVDQVVADFVRTHMIGHPAQARLIASENAALAPAIRPEVSEPT